MTNNKPLDKHVARMEAQMDKFAKQFVEAMMFENPQERAIAVGYIFKCMAMSAHLLSMGQIKDIISSSQAEVATTVMGVSPSILAAARKAGNARWN